MRETISENALAITADLTVDEVMCRWPATIAVFLRRRMACIGCAVGPFHTVAEASAQYGLAPKVLIDDLRRAAGAA